MPRAKVAKESAVKEAPNKEVKAAKKTAEVVEQKVEVKPVVLEEVRIETKVQKTESISKFTKEITPEQLFEVGAHFGHVVKKWNPKMAKYLWGAKSGVHIFDLEQTAKMLTEAGQALAEYASAGKRIVILGTKRQARGLVAEMAAKAGIPFLSTRWMGGLLTNWKQVKQSIDRLNSLKFKRDRGDLKKYTKKEQVLFDKEIAKLERVLGGISMLKEMPEVLVVIDTHKERLAVQEAKLRNAKVIGIVDSNANPDVVDFPVPMNDDTSKGLELVIGYFVEAIEAGRKELSK